MRERVQRSKKSKPRAKGRGGRERSFDDYDRITAGSLARRGGRKRQLEELTEKELEEMLDLTNQVGGLAEETADL